MAETPSDILIFGAGFGTRMRPLTNDQPKPLINVGGRALIDHALEIAKDAGLSIHVNAHYRADQLVTHLPPSVQTHVESPDILDTGGGLKAALPAMHGQTVMTLNSDAVWTGPNPCTLLKEHWRGGMDALLLMVPLAQTVGYNRPGSFRVSVDGSLSVDARGEVYTGAQIIRRDVVEAIDKPVFGLREVWDALIERGTAYGTLYPGRWADVGTPEGIPLAEALLRDV